MTRKAPIIYPLKGRRVFVAGHRGMVGSALLRRLSEEDCAILTAGREEIDLRDQAAVNNWFRRYGPDTVFLAAAHVGGIYENATHPGEFLYDNLVIATNVIEAARRTGVRKLMFLGSSCIYPRLAPQPMRETCLLTGPLEPTNEWYAIAKIAGLKLCQAYRRQYKCDFVSIMPTNLYGPNDNFDLLSAHVMPALIAKIDAAARSGRQAVTIWGTGNPRREFLHVDDLATAAVFLMKAWSEEEPVNVGTGEDISILELAQTIRQIIGYRGDFVLDTSKPDGAPQKLLDTSKLRGLGWRPHIDLKTGIQDTYGWYRNHVSIST